MSHPLVRLQCQAAALALQAAAYLVRKSLNHCRQLCNTEYRVHGQRCVHRRFVAQKRSSTVVMLYFLLCCVSGTRATDEGLGANQGLVSGVQLRVWHIHAQEVIRTDPERTRQPPYR